MSRYLTYLMIKLLQLGLTANQATNLLNTNWQQVSHYEQLITQNNITVVCIFDALYPEDLRADCKCAFIAIL